jgi:hypothetical protein
MSSSLIKAGLALALAAANEWLQTHPGEGWTLIGRNTQTGEPVLQGQPEILPDGPDAAGGSGQGMSPATQASDIGFSASDANMPLA